MDGVSEVLNDKQKTFVECDLPVCYWENQRREGATTACIHLALQCLMNGENVTYLTNNKVVPNTINEACKLLTTTTSMEISEEVPFHIAFDESWLKCITFESELTLTEDMYSGANMIIFDVCELDTKKTIDNIVTPLLHSSCKERKVRFVGHDMPNFIKEYVPSLF